MAHLLVEIPLSCDCPETWGSSWLWSGALWLDTSMAGDAEGMYVLHASIPRWLVTSISSFRWLALLGSSHSGCGYSWFWSMVHTFKDVWPVGLSLSGPQKIWHLYLQRTLWIVQSIGLPVLTVSHKSNRAALPAKFTFLLGIFREYWNTCHPHAASKVPQFAVK